MNGMSDTSPARIYLDTNAFIEMYENRSSYSNRIWNIFSQTVPPKIVLSSELTLAEILVKPIEQAHMSGHWNHVYNYREHISNKGAFQTIIPVSRAILDMAANVRALNKNIKLPDAIHLSTAIIEKCDFFVSNDLKLASSVRDANPRFPILRFVTFDELQTESFQVTKS
jgi:predicted nucleic acid-binding protein